MNLYEEQSANVRKSWLLVAGFLVGVIAIGWVISQYFADPVILYVAVALAIGTNFYAYWQSDKLVLSMNKARPATKEEFFDYYTVAENTAIAAGLPMPKLYVIDDPAPNAFATGRDAEHAAVCATTGLLSMMTRPELEGVLAHEFSHIRNKDMLLMTLAVVLAGFVAIAANIFLRVSFYGGARRNDNGNGNAIVLVLAIIGLILAPIAAQLIQLAISRRREYLADASGALLTRYPEGLVSALEKLGQYQAPMKNANLATSHLFINDPFGKHPSGSGWVEKLFSTHPPIQSRIQALLGK